MSLKIIKKTIIVSFAINFLLIFGLVGIYLITNVSSSSNYTSTYKYTNKFIQSSYKNSKNLKKSSLTSAMHELTDMPFGKNLIGIAKNGLDPELNKLYCADIDKYGDIALGFKNIFIIFSYNPTYNSSMNGSFPIGTNGEGGSYNEHIIVNNINTIKNQSNFTSVSGLNSLLGTDFIPSSASFDNNGDLLFSYTVDLSKSVKIFAENEHSGLIYIPYTRQFDGLTNPTFYSQTKNINYGIDIINQSTTGTYDLNHQNDYKVLENYNNNTGNGDKAYIYGGLFTHDGKDKQFPIVEHIERISSAQLSYDGNYIIFTSSRSGSRSNPDPISLWGETHSDGGEINTKGLVLTFMMKKQINDKFDRNKDIYVVGKGKNQADKTDPTKKNVKLNNSGFFISKVFPVYYNYEWNTHDLAFVHSYSALNKDNYVALSGDVYWNGYENVNPIRISKHPISQLYDNNVNIPNVIVNKQFQVGNYDILSLNSSKPDLSKKTIDHSNYITTNANSNTFYSIASNEKQGFKTNYRNSFTEPGVSEYGINFITNNGDGDKYDPSNSNYKDLYFGNSSDESVTQQNQLFNDITISGNNSIGVSFSSDWNNDTEQIVNKNSNFAFTWGTHRSIDVSNNIYSISRQMTFNNKLIPETPISNEDMGGEAAGGNLLIRFNKFSGITDTDTDVFLSTSESLSGGGYMFFHHDKNDVKPHGLPYDWSIINKAQSIGPEYPINPTSPIIKHSNKLIAILLPLLAIFTIFSFIVSIFIIIFLKKRKVKKTQINNKSITNKY